MPDTPGGGKEVVQMIIRVLVPVIISILILVSPASVCPAEVHNPRFTWQVHGGVVNPEQWIYDGDIPIALFENRTVEQPGRQLLFFNRIQRPLVLRKVRLSPSGEPLVDGIQLYCSCGDIVTEKLLNLDVQGQGTGRLVVTFVSGDLFGVMTLRRVLTLTYDGARESYVYDFQDELTFNSPEFFNGSPIAVEFCDPWFTGCPGPAVEFTGMWEKRYQYFVYEAINGSVVKIPVNHFITSHKGGMRITSTGQFATGEVPDMVSAQQNGIWLRENGLFIAAHEPDGNPAIEFVGGTARHSSINICWWGYDIHLSRQIMQDELFAPVPVHFRVFDCPDETVDRLVAAGAIPPLGPDECGGKDEYPVYERISSFEKGLRLDGVYDGPVDPFCWESRGDGAVWEKTSGRTGDHSLKISTTTPGLTRWQTLQGDGEGFFADPWTPCTGYRVSCYVKTNEVAGRGSTIAVQYYVPHPPQLLPIQAAQKLTGTRDWTKLDIEVGPPPPYPPVTGVLMIMLQQDGSGTTWFDDLEVTPLR